MIGDLRWYNLACSRATVLLRKCGAVEMFSRLRVLGLVLLVKVL